MKANPTFKPLVRLMLLAGLLTLPAAALADPPVASGATNTTVGAAGNGVPVVNIATPNGTGLSHNKYTSYNVGTNGLVLNNGDQSSNFRLSQLAGQVAANPNLAAGQQASVILNEVTGNNRSVLAGYTEVLGGRASVVVANPFGITCGGCGFINTDRVSLVTGTPNISGGALASFDVRGGDILVTGTGLDASAQQLLDLVSRRVAVNGQINAHTLNVVAGSNRWNYASNATTPIASDGDAAPAWAIDSSALGGMYAGRITLKSTESGAGVRMLGNAAATADDFVITSAGKIEMRGQASAARDIAVTSTTPLPGWRFDPDTGDAIPPAAAAPPSAAAASSPAAIWPSSCSASPIPPAPPPASPTPTSATAPASPCTARGVGNAPTSTRPASGASTASATAPPIP